MTRLPILVFSFNKKNAYYSSMPLWYRIQSFVKTCNSTENVIACL
jgi:hypothetical protein